jgi:hypothetical protein
MTRARKRDWPEWPKELTKPIPGAKSPEDEVRVAEELHRRMALLFDVFDLTGWPDPDWRNLAWALAIEYVPGLQIAASGRRRRWDDFAQATLLADVAVLKAEKPERSTADALRQLVRKGVLVGKLGALRRRYDEACANDVAQQIADGLLRGDKSIMVRTVTDLVLSPPNARK